jgi:hypothetical protein
VLGHGRRQLLWFAVTRHPTAEWLAQQIVEAFPWGTAPTYLVRDNVAPRASLHKSNPGDGDSGSPYITEVARAESICRAPDRHAPASAWITSLFMANGICDGSCLCIRSITMRRVRTWGWRRRRRYDEPSNDLGTLSPRQSCPACIIDTRGYDSGRTGVTRCQDMASFPPGYDETQFGFVVSWCARGRALLD